MIRQGTPSGVLCEARFERRLQPLKVSTLRA